MIKFLNEKMYYRYADIINFKKTPTPEELQYDPAFISTDEEWLKKRIRTFAKENPELADIECDTKDWFRVSIPKDKITLCIP